MDESINQLSIGGLDPNNGAAFESLTEKAQIQVTSSLDLISHSAPKLGSNDNNNINLSAWGRGASYMRFRDSNPLEIDEDMCNHQLAVFEHESIG